MGAINETSYRHIFAMKITKNPIVNTIFPSQSPPHLHVTLNLNSLPFPHNSNPNSLPTATLCVSLQKRPFPDIVHRYTSTTARARDNLSNHRNSQ